MNDDTLSDTTSAGVDFGRKPTIVPFKPKLVTPKVTQEEQALVDAADPGIVEMLENYLKAAKAGRVKFVAIASVDSLGVAFSTWEPEGDCSPQLITQALGAVGYLHHRFNRSCDEGAEYGNDAIPEA